MMYTPQSPSQASWWWWKSVACIFNTRELLGKWFIRRNTYAVIQNQALDDYLLKYELFDMSRKGQKDYKRVL